MLVPRRVRLYLTIVGGNYEDSQHEAVKLIYLGFLGSCSDENHQESRVTVIMNCTPEFNIDTQKNGWFGKMRLKIWLCYA